MNCQELSLLLDERDLERLPAAERSVAEAHLAGCPACAGDHGLHRGLNALPIPPLDADRIASWRAVALADAGAESRQRLRNRLIVIGALIAVAAAAAMLAVHMRDVPEQPVATTMPAPPIQHESLDSGLQAPAAETVLADAEQRPVQLPTAAQRDGTFTVLVLPLQVDGGHPAARSMGEEFHSRFLDQLRQIPGLKLQQESRSATAAKPAAFRLRITSAYGKVPERFGGHEQWIQNLVAEIYSEGTGSYTQVLGFSINPDCGRISPVDFSNASMCTPAGMVELDIQQLRRNVFPPDPSATRQLQTRFLDTAQPQGVRRQALADLIELRRRAPAAMDPELIRVIVGDAIANAPNPSQRLNLWRALRGQAAGEMVQPLIANLRREADDTVRLEMVGILASEFSADPAARIELDLVAKRDTKLLVRKVAERALSGDASWRSYVVSTVKDSNLPAAQRFEPLGWMAETSALARGDAKMDLELAAVARQLFDDGEAVALAEVLSKASSGPARPVAGVVQIRMTSIQHPAVADFLIATIERQQDFSAFSLLGRHRADPRVEAKLKDMASNHPEANVRQLAAAQLITQ